MDTNEKTNICSWQKATHCWTGDLPLTLHTVNADEGGEQAEY